MTDMTASSVIIYKDPLHRTMEEGRAELVEYVRDEMRMASGTRLQVWRVCFEGERAYVYRRVLVYANGLPVGQDDECPAPVSQYKRRFELAPAVATADVGVRSWRRPK